LLLLLFTCIPNISVLFPKAIQLDPSDFYLTVKIVLKFAFDY